MKILAIETASEACSVALSCGSDVEERYALSPRGHAEQVLPWVQELLSAAAIKLGELDAIAFSRGPGSFTSLRIGIGIVQGLAWGADRRVIPCSSLQAAAEVAAKSGIEQALVAMDARMGEVYCGSYVLNDEGRMTALGDEFVGPPERLEALLLKDMACVGNGFDRFPVLRSLSRNSPTVRPEIGPRAAAMIPMAECWLTDKAALPALDAQPVYLRDNVARKPSGN